MTAKPPKGFYLNPQWLDEGFFIVYMIGGKKMHPLYGSNNNGEILTDFELEQLVYDILDKMEYDDVKKLCKELEIICCYMNPVVYH
jgi:hypothetical protein